MGAYPDPHHLNVGNDTLLPSRIMSACTSYSAHGLVEDRENTMTITDSPYALEISRDRRYAAKRLVASYQHQSRKKIRQLFCI